MLLVLNGKVICPDKIIEGGAVLVDGNLISEVGSSTDLKSKHPNARLIDAGGGLIMPGLINTHMHFYSTFARGMSIPGEPAGNFVEILERLWWRLDKKLTNEDTYYSALIPMIESIKCGTTTIIDHHASPFAVNGSLDLIAKAVREMGLRAALCYEVSDRDGSEIAMAGIKENERFIIEHKDEDQLTGLMGLHASFTVSDKTMDKAVRTARDLGVGCHIHTAEDAADVRDAKEKYKMGVVERLHARGLLGKMAICAHCIHINDREIELLAETDTNVVHNPESNMNNAVGCAPVIKMFEMGALVGLGTDGMTSDMFRESKVANILHKFANNDPRVGFMESFRMATKNNADVASKIFPKKVGVIEKGAYADIIILDYKAPTPLMIDNFAGHFLFGLSAGDVITTIASGKVLMEDRKLVGVDEEGITVRSRELAKKLWQRI